MREEEREKFYVEISEMWCPSCAEIIRLMLLNEKGVINCVVDYATDLAAIEFSSRHISKDKLLTLIKSLGYIPISLDAGEKKAVSRSLYLRFGVAVFCSLNIMMFAYPLYATYFNYDGEGYGPLFAWLSFAASLPVVFYSGWPIWRRVVNSLSMGILGMETLVALGVGGALIASLVDMFQGGVRVYYDSMAVIIVFVLLGKIVESRAKFSAKESLKRLSRSSPRRGRRREADGSLNFVLVKEIGVGDILVAFPGERIALDGIVIEGEGACDESLITGEAIPLTRKEGERLLSGTILVQGRLAYRVTNNEAESALHKIIEMVERDIGQKTVYVRAADSIVRWFVPMVIIVAALAAITYWFFPDQIDQYPGETALMRALSVLLIAAPAAESYLLNSLASIGVIVRNRGCLPLLGAETVMIFDKTGTVTEGHYTVQEGMETLSDQDRSALLGLASQSNHPVACAIAAALADERPSDVSSLEEVVGQGMKGIVGESLYLIGSMRLLQQNGISILEKEQNCFESVLSTVYIGKEDKCIARLLLGDKVRPQVKELVESHSVSVRSILLSGDSESAVAAVARQCGFAEWRSGCTPLEKRAFVEALKQQGYTVCMIGDGINDAPALTSAHIGVSVVSATDISIQVSDLLLTTDNLSVLKKMRTLAQKGVRIVRQNLFWAFFYNVIGMALAFGGILSPIFAAFAMSVSSLTVLFNAKRLRDCKEIT